jgi:hypothetical protein
MAIDQCVFVGDSGTCLCIQIGAQPLREAYREGVLFVDIAGQAIPSQGFKGLPEQPASFALFAWPDRVVERHRPNGCTVFQAFNRPAPAANHALGVARETGPSVNRERDDAYSSAKCEKSSNASGRSLRRGVRSSGAL